jgi:biotin transporter BioY
VALSRPQGETIPPVIAVCAFVLHHYVNLNTGLKRTLEPAAGYFIEWTVVGIVIGLLYKPAAAAAR